MSRSASIKESLLKSAGPKPVLNKDQSEPKRTSPLEYRRTLATQNRYKPLHTDLKTYTHTQDWPLSAVCVSLQTAVMVRVGTEEDEEEDEEDEKPSSQEQDVSYELSNSKHSTLMSGGHWRWALFSIKLLSERLDWKTFSLLLCVSQTGTTNLFSE